MTPREFADQLVFKAKELKTSNLPLQIAAATVHAAMSKRIFTDGKAANESSIGSYSKKEIYIKAISDPIGGFGKKKKPYGIAPRNMKGLDPKKGKDGETGFKTTDRARITSFFEGWKGFREVQGLKTDKVNLNYTGDMKSDFDRPLKKISPQEYQSSFSRDLNSKKATGNEDHFNQVIFKLTESEKRLFFTTIEKELALRQ